MARFAYGNVLNSALRLPRSNGFSPSALFAASEPGAWYDPSDLSTMFQDSAGTTPVTATGQTVGLVLDKSKGLVLGPELRGTGAPALLGTAPAATYDTGTGAATATRVNGTNLSGVTFTGIASPFVKVSFTVSSGSATGVRFRSGSLSGATIADVSAGQSFTGFAQTTGGQISLTALSDGNTATFTLISVKELPGNHATQATAASRPQYQVDGNGKAFLLFDGTDDFLVTPTITPGIDKAQVFAGVRKLSDAAQGIVVESSTSSLANSGAFMLRAPAGANATYGWFSWGAAGVGGTATTSASYTSPITNVLTGLGDIAGDVATIRVNGTQVATGATDQGTGNYLAYPLYIGRRGGTSLPFNGRIYGLVTRFGANLTTDQITQTETWMNSKTGA